MLSLKTKDVNNKCPKCESINTLYRDDDRINGAKAIACIVCGWRTYDFIDIKKKTKGGK